MEAIVDKSEQTMGNTREGRALTALASFVLDTYEQNKRHREGSGMNAELLACKYAAAGEYSPEELAKLRANGMPAVYVPLSDTKRRAAMAWASEIFLNTSEKTYLIRATPVPEMPEAVEQAVAVETIQEWAQVVSPEPPQGGVELQAVAEMAQKRRDELERLVKEEADRRAARLDRVIQDKLTEGRWREEMQIAIDYLATYGTVVVKLVNRPRKRLKRTVNKYGLSKFHVDVENKMEFRAIDPLDCYPSRGARSIQDGYFCQRLRYTPQSLSEMIGKSGFVDDAIREVLAVYAETGFRKQEAIDTENDHLNRDNLTTERTSTIEGVEFWGAVPGRILKENGLHVLVKGKSVKDEVFYDVDCIVAGDLVIYCEIVDNRLGRALFKGTFYHVPGNWWGESPIKKMRSIQKIANGAITSMVFNMGMASGPQVAITDYERLRDRDLSQRPWKVWVFNKAKNGTTDVPIKFFQPSTNSSELMALYDRMSREADSLTGIPAYAYGSDTAAGAGRTASGLSMLMDFSQRGMKHFAFSFDMDVNRPAITYLAHLEMLTSADEGIKGDVAVEAGGLLAIMTRDKSLNQLHEVLALCQNPLVANVIGEDGIAELLRKMVCLIPHINPDRIVPTREEREFRQLKQQLEQLRLAQLQQQMAGQQQAQGATDGRAIPQAGESQQPGAIPLTDGVANVAAMGGQTPGSAYNQYQPNRAPDAPMGDADVMG